jgi:hypothetical protein
MIDVDDRIQRATRRNTFRSRAERSAGFAAPEDCSLEVALRTVVCAIHAGLVLEDWDCIAEGLVLLGHVTKFQPWNEKKGA